MSSLQLFHAGMGSFAAMQTSMCQTGDQYDSSAAQTESIQVRTHA